MADSPPHRQSSNQHTRDNDQNDGQASKTSSNEDTLDNVHAHIAALEEIVKNKHDALSRFLGDLLHADDLDLVAQMLQDFNFDTRLSGFRDFRAFGLTDGLTREEVARRAIDFIRELQTMLTGPLQATFTVGLVGPTGAGKSSAINAILDADVQAVHDGAVSCTAVATRIEKDCPKYPHASARLQMITRDQFLSNLHRAQTSMRDRYENIDDEDNEEDANPVEHGMAAVFASTGISARQFINLTDSEALVRLRRRDLLDKCLDIQGEDLSDLRAKLEPYLDDHFGSEQWSSTIETELLWPLVSNITIFVDSPILTHGLSIVDTPGNNDTNEARRQEYRKVLFDCKVLILVSILQRMAANTAFFAVFEEVATQYVYKQIGEVVLIGTRADAPVSDNRRRQTDGPTPEMKDNQTRAEQEVKRLRAVKQLADTRAKNAESARHSYQRRGAAYDRAMPDNNDSNSIAKGRVIYDALFVDDDEENALRLPRAGEERTVISRQRCEERLDHFTEKAGRTRAAAADAERQLTASMLELDRAARKVRELLPRTLEEQIHDRNANNLDSTRQQTLSILQRKRLVGKDVTIKQNPPQLPQTFAVSATNHSAAKPDPGIRSVQLIIMDRSARHRLDVLRAHNRMLNDNVAQMETRRAHKARQLDPQAAEQLRQSIDRCLNHVNHLYQQSRTGTALQHLLTRVEASIKRKNIPDPSGRPGQSLLWSELYQTFSEELDSIRHGQPNPPQWSVQTLKTVCQKGEFQANKSAQYAASYPGRLICLYRRMGLAGSRVYDSLLLEALDNVSGILPAGLPASATEARAGVRTMIHDTLGGVNLVSAFQTALHAVYSTANARIQQAFREFERDVREIPGDVQELITHTNATRGIIQVVWASTLAELKAETSYKGKPKPGTKATLLKIMTDSLTKVGAHGNLYEEGFIARFQARTSRAVNDSLLNAVRQLQTSLAQIRTDVHTRCVRALREGTKTTTVSDIRIENAFKYFSRYDFQDSDSFDLGYKDPDNDLVGDSNLRTSDNQSNIAGNNAYQNVPALTTTTSTVQPFPQFSQGQTDNLEDQAINTSVSTSRLANTTRQLPSAYPSTIVDARRLPTGSNTFGGLPASLPLLRPVSNFATDARSGILAGGLSGRNSFGGVRRTRGRGSFGRGGNILPSIEGEQQPTGYSSALPSTNLFAPQQTSTQTQGTGSAIPGVHVEVKEDRDEDAQVIITIDDDDDDENDINMTDVGAVNASSTKVVSDEYLGLDDIDDRP